jgi:phage tail-like protein
MAIAQSRAQLGQDELLVEAGATIETALQIWPADDERADEIAIALDGLPERWYTLEADRVPAPVDQAAEVLLVFHPPHDDQLGHPGRYPFRVTLAPSLGEPLTLDGHLRVLPPGGASLRSRLLQYLPGAFQDDFYLARFLLIFQSILDPLEGVIDNAHHYLDPSVTPPQLLEWLGSWVGTELEPGASELTQRELIRRAVELARWKGTRRGLREELKLRLGARPLIVENFDGFRIGQDAAMGVNTHLGVRHDRTVTVTLAASEGAPVDRQRADDLVDEIKPAHVRHILRIVPAPARPAPVAPATVSVNGNLAEPEEGGERG